MSLAPLTEVVRKRLYALYKKKRLNPAEVAHAVGITPNAVRRNLGEEGRPLTLAFVDACARVADEPIAELVAPIGSLVRQLSPDENTVLRYVRAWPKSVLRAFVLFLRYFAKEAPEEREFRDLVERWRGLVEKDRKRILDIATVFREKALTPDQRAAIAARYLDGVQLDAEGRVVELSITGSELDDEDDGSA